MTPEKFIEEIEKNDTFDYGLCTPPVDADKGLNILIKHFLGDDWYSVMPMSNEQIYTEAIYKILKKYKRPQPILSRLIQKFKK